MFPAQSKRNRRQILAPLVATLWLCHVAAPSCGYVPATRWTNVSTGNAGQMGDPITLTWSIIPDGTIINLSPAGINRTSSSDFVAFMDREFGAGPGGADYRQRPWFARVEAPFQRWSELSGITFVYEPFDDGAGFGSTAGLAFARGDIRMGGTFFDGPGGVDAFSFFPDHGGDVSIDTSNVAFLNDATGFGNLVMHELGHAIGLKHILSDSDAFLMESVVTNSFLGPQLDDIRGVQAFYGDPREKGNSNMGNNTPTLATSLGALPRNGMLSVGADAGPDTVVEANNIEFVSISSQSDVDFYSFTIDSAGILDVALTPHGGSFRQAEEGFPQTVFNASAKSNLALALFGPEPGTLLATANSVPAGGVEALNDVSIVAPGTYYVRVTGDSSVMQLYQLAVTIGNQTISTGPDFDRDSDVDGDDLLLWETNFGAGAGGDADQDGDSDGDDFLAWQRATTGVVAPPAGLAADFDENGIVDAMDMIIWEATASDNAAADADDDGDSDGDDFLIWQSQFGASAPASSLAIVPEPAGVALAALGWAFCQRGSRARKARQTATLSR